MCHYAKHIDSHFINSSAYTYILYKCIQYICIQIAIKDITPTLIAQNE